MLVGFSQRLERSGGWGESGHFRHFLSHSSKGICWKIKSKNVKDSILAHVVA